MTGLLIDTAGWVGAAALLVAYGLVSSARFNGSSIRFQLLNLFGALGLLANGVWHGAWPSAALNVVWLLISLTALGRLIGSPELDGPARAATGSRATCGCAAPDGADGA